MVNETEILNVTFKAFNLDASPQCLHDYLMVSDSIFEKSINSSILSDMDFDECIMYFE